MKKKKLELRKHVIAMLSDVEQRQVIGGNQILNTEDPCISADICTGPELCPVRTVCNNDCLSFPTNADLNL